MHKYGEILRDIEQKIMDGHYRPGQKLPSVRHAAKLYDCSAGTIARTYAELEKRHAIYAISQSGFYVVEKPAERHRATNSPMIDFASASPDSNVFP